MAVNKEIERLDKSNVKLNVTIPKEEVQSRYDEMLRDYAKNIQMDGFRKGKVPKQVLERKFGEALKQDAVGRIIEGALTEIFKDESLARGERPLPYSTPSVEGEPKLSFEEDLKFSVIYDVLPDVKISQWKGLTVEVPDVEVSEKDIDRELDGIRERNSVVLDRDEDAPAQNGDVVTVDYSFIDENGSEIQDTLRKDFVFTLGTGYHVYKIDDEITGMKKGETRDFDKTFPADFSDPDLAGKTKRLRVTMTAIKEKRLPDLDDDLAQDVDEKFKTLQDLKDSIKERLEKNLEFALKDHKINEIIKTIMENTPVTLPESMIGAEVESHWRKLARNFGTSAETIKQMMSRGEKGLEGIEAEWRLQAEKALHSRLIVETLIDEQKFEVTDEDMNKEMEKIAAENNTDIQEIKKRYDEENALEYLREGIKERMLFDIILAENTFKKGIKKEYLDLISNKS